MRHYSHDQMSSHTLCGITREGAESSLEESDRLCLGCDRIIRDRYVRAPQGLPPLTDEEFAEIHNRPRRRVLVVDGSKL